MTAKLRSESVATQQYSLCDLGFSQRTTSTSEVPCSLALMTTMIRVPSLGALSMDRHCSGSVGRMSFLRPCCAEHGRSRGSGASSHGFQFSVVGAAFQPRADPKSPPDAR